MNDIDRHVHDNLKCASCMNPEAWMRYYQGCLYVLVRWPAVLHSWGFDISLEKQLVVFCRVRQILAMLSSNCPLTRMVWQSSCKSLMCNLHRQRCGPVLLSGIRVLWKDGQQLEGRLHVPRWFDNRITQRLALSFDSWLRVNMFQVAQQFYLLQRGLNSRIPVWLTLRLLCCWTISSSFGVKISSNCSALCHPHLSAETHQTRQP